MKKLKNIFLIIIMSFFTQFSIFAKSERLKTYFEIKPNDPEALGLTSEEYHKILGTFMVEYFQTVKKETGLDFVVNFDWNNNYFGAFANKEIKNGKPQYAISLWGGMARAEGMTTEVAYLILCHELGHIMAGEPKQTIPGAEWASSEGQSDFFAAKRCMPELMKKIKFKKRFSSSRVKSICRGNQDCETIASIGKEFVEFTQKWSYQNYSDIHFDQAPMEKPKKLLRNVYPSDQCRLESVIQGASCLVDNKCIQPACWYVK